MTDFTGLEAPHRQPNGSSGNGQPWLLLGIVALLGFAAVIRRRLA